MSFALGGKGFIECAHGFPVVGSFTLEWDKFPGADVFQARRDQKNQRVWDRGAPWFAVNPTLPHCVSASEFPEICLGSKMSPIYSSLCISKMQTTCQHIIQCMDKFEVIELFSLENRNQNRNPNHELEVLPFDKSTWGSGVRQPITKLVVHRNLRMIECKGPRNTKMGSAAEPREAPFFLPPLLSLKALWVRVLCGSHTHP